MSSDGFEKPDIGTCFVLEHNFLDDEAPEVQTERLVITARHCVENMDSVDIPGISWNSKPTIWVHTNPEVDIAVILPNDGEASHLKGIRFAAGAVLDEVLVMGYPPIANFDSIQTAEIASIAAKTTVGAIVGIGAPYRTPEQELLLISARVKGGNSGGPVINEGGFVVGVVTDAPNDPSNPEKVDALGFGIATPIQRLQEMFGDSPQRLELFCCLNPNGTLSTLSASERNYRDTSSAKPSETT